MLLELAIGDAYGAGYEFAPPEFVAEYNTLSGYRQHPRHRLQPGSYTDDTQMSLAIAETLISGDPWTPEVLADRFVRTFKRDPREGYAGRFYELLMAIETGAELREKLPGTSDKSGAAMRSAPVGILPAVEGVIEAARIQAAVTHNSTGGIDSAIAAALMSHYFLYRLGKKAELGEFLSAHVPGDWLTPWQGKAGTSGLECVRAARSAIGQNDSLSAILKDCIAFTGDVDTVAAIALAAASSSEEVEPDLPEHLIVNLENNTYGRSYLIDLDRQLMNCFHRFKG
jgi:ADP-ribosylglycohydrolase